MNQINLNSYRWQLSLIKIQFVCFFFIFVTSDLHFQMSALLKEIRNCILLNTLVRSLFCLIRLYVGLHFFTDSFRKLRLSAISLNRGIKISVVIMLCNFVYAVLFSSYIKTHLFINNKLFKNVLYIVLCKNMLSEMF